MTSSSDNTKRSSAVLPLIAILLFAASTPLPVHGQFTGGPFSILTTATSLLSGLTGPILPTINVIPNIIAPILSSTLPVTLNVVGQLTCPGQGTGVGGVPVNLTCVTNGLQVLNGQSVTNGNGSFAVNATVSPLGALGLISNLLPNNTLPCLVSAPAQLVRSVVTCPTITNATNTVSSIVQLATTNVFSIVGRVLNANAGGSAAV